MPISSSTLNAIQKVGAAAFTADEKLKKEVQSYAEHVNMAMVKNPYNLGNDALIEAWKVVARLSKTMIGIEEELRNIHRIASELTQDDQPSVRDTPALAAPITKKRKVKKIDAAVTTVKVKTKKPVAAKPAADVAPAAPAKAVKKVTTGISKVTTKATAKAIPKAVVKAKSNKTKAATASVHTQDLKGNSAKLMAQLQVVLNTADFTSINQSAVAKVAGIPVGSMGATIGRLVKAGRIVSHNNGSLKLTTTPAAAATAAQADAQSVAAVPTESAANA
ncbi:hypothetical protein [Rhodoferax sp.]|uniref:hypothetical protein n=1 Tax=Rhodoferax sp. TaxID=50421 RepID=UPI00284C854C|nr:hypothetical protein [Rhodoferax sp.]MDR3368165.1 hypothetical protein [Rhodoferax sp.]